MKKLGIIIGFVLTFFIIYLLQVNIFSNLTINGIRPNLFVIFVLFIGLFAQSEIYKQQSACNREK